MEDRKSERILFYHLDGVRKGDVDAFDQPSVVIGRSDEAHLRFDSHRERSVSAHHAVIRYESGRFEVVDTRSTNGTYLNGQRIERAFLEDGDLVRFGALGPEVKIGVPSRTKERTIHDGQILPPAGSDTEVEGAAPFPRPVLDDTVAKIRHHRFIRNTMAVYVGAAVALVGLSDSVVDRYDLSPSYFSAALSLLGGGLIATFVLVLYHGRPGRQKMTKVELLYLILITLATASAVIGFIIAAQPSGG